MTDPVVVVEPRPEASNLINQTRDLATRYVLIANDTRALSDEVLLSGWANPEDAGGLTATDFKGNERVNRDSVLAFYQVIGKLLGSLTDAERAAIYAVKR
jgi:hypothetical protein